MAVEALAAGVGGAIGAFLSNTFIVKRLPDGSISVSVKPLRFLDARTITVDVSPKQILATNVRSVLIKADAGNSDDVFIGNASVSPSNGFQLQKEEAISFNVSNPQDIFVVAKSGVQKIHVITLGE